MYWENQIRRIRNRQNLYVDWILGLREEGCQPQISLLRNRRQTLVGSGLPELESFPQTVEKAFPHRFYCHHFRSKVEKTGMLRAGVRRPSKTALSNPKAINQSSKIYLPSR